MGFLSEKMVNSETWTWSLTTNLIFYMEGEWSLKSNFLAEEKVSSGSASSVMSSFFEMKRFFFSAVYGAARFI